MKPLSLKITESLFDANPMKSYEYGEKFRAILYPKAGQNWKDRNFYFDSNGTLTVTPSSETLGFKQLFLVKPILQRLAKEGVKQIAVEGGDIQLVISAQDYIRNIRLDGSNTLCLITGRNVQLDNWNISAERIIVERAGDCGFRNCTFDGEELTVYKGRNWEWKDNTLVGIKSVELDFRKDPGEDLRALLGDSINSRTLEDVFCGCQNPPKATIHWNRAPGSNEWKRL